MIDIYRNASYRCEINVFNDRDEVDVSEIVLKEKTVFGEVHKYAEPVKPGSYAFGGSFLFTNNGCFPDFSGRPVPLHDRDMSLEGGSPND